MQSSVRWQVAPAKSLGVVPFFFFFLESSQWHVDTGNLHAWNYTVSRVLRTACRWLEGDKRLEQGPAKRVCDNLGEGYWGCIYLKAGIAGTERRGIQRYLGSNRISLSLKRCVDLLGVGGEAGRSQVRKDWWWLEGWKEAHLCASGRKRSKRAIWTEGRQRQSGGEQDSVGSPTESPVFLVQAPESEHWVVGSLV